MSVETKSNYWKFRSIERACQLIENSELWFAHKDTLNDPFDLNVNLASELSKLKGELSNYEILEKSIKEQLPYHEELLSNLFVFSTSEGKPYLDVRLWAYYGESHAGVCIGLSMLTVRQKLKSCNRWHKEDKRWLIMPTERSIYYDDFRPRGFVKWVDGHIAYQGNSHVNGIFYRYAYLKSADWAYENEVRFMTYEPTRNGELGVAVPLGAEDLIDIVFGCRTKQDDKQKIIDLIKKKGWQHVRYWQSTLTNDVGLLSISQI